MLSQIEEHERLLLAKPESFAEIEREYEAANEEMAKLTESIERLGKERRRVDGELAEQQELLKKYQGQLMQVKNQQQYAAAWKEIDASRKHVKDLEESLLKTMTEVEGLQAQLDGRRAAHEALEGRHNEAHESWQHSLGDLRQEAEDLRRRATALEDGIDARLKREFHRIYKQRQSIAVARVVSDACGACRNRIRPQVAQQLKRGELVHCENCSRILYPESPTS
ncbi:MAG TPA: C4-type zinc ribbon domain-containing protein [Thermoanaerobaculia bacterium]|nr:C4-type zinc ribbon domain-containing protein [Thermoanaerobaculia bacterium]